MSAGSVSRVASSTVQNTWRSLGKALTPPRMVQQLYYKLIYYPHLGLYKDDLTRRNFYRPGVLNEAVKRLPVPVQEERQFRINKALMHSGNKTILPKEEWLPLDKDVTYLSGALDSVVRDIETRNYWDLNGEEPPVTTNYLTPEMYSETMKSVIATIEPNE